MSVDDLRDNEQGLRFLLRGPDGAPFRRTQCWLKREPGLKMSDWSLHLTRPEGEVVSVTDLKQWLLFQSHEYRFFESDRRTRAVDLRRYDRDTVLEKYLQAVLHELPEARQTSPVWCLIPSIGDLARRKRYREAIQRALPRARILHEPEMVVEFFRLVRRELTLVQGKSSIFLVIDAGASTCNFTFVITRRDQVVVDAVSGAARKTALRAKQGDAAEIAGHWVDVELGVLLGINRQLAALTPDARGDALRAIELAKLDAARAGRVVFKHRALLGDHVIDGDLLRRAANRMWDRLVPIYRTVAEKLLDDLRNDTDDYFRDRLSTHGIRDADDVQHLIDGVILAGGSSQLPGFTDAMLAHVFTQVDAQAVRIHTVGTDYGTAAAAGALAHVLHQHHRPGRLHADAALDLEDTLSDATFQGTPTTDIYLAWKPPGQPERKLMVLDRDDGFIETTGQRPIDGMPELLAGVKFDARLVPGDEYSYVGRQPQELEVTRSPGRMMLAWDSRLQEASVLSEQVRGARALHLAFASLSPEHADRDDPRGARSRPAARLWTDGAPDIIIDLGMSKTVVACAERGPFEMPFAVAVDAAAAPDAIVASSAPAPEEVAVLPGPAGQAAPVAQLVAVPSAPPPIVALPMLVPPPLPVAPTPTPAPATIVTTAQPRLVGTGTSGGSEAHVAQEAAILPLHRAPLVAEFGPALAEALAPLRAQQRSAMAADLTMLMLALTVRPFVLLAGPPGSGKSTLVRVASRLLGLEDAAFFDVPVQAHWRTERQVPQAVRRAWEDNAKNEVRMFLFDEVNVARPENYLMPLFHRLDRQRHRGGPLLVCGTLNIDDASRPPSPKVIDRSLLMEIDAPRKESGRAMRSAHALQLGKIFALPHVDDLPEETHPAIADAFDAVRERAEKSAIREDLLPSHRDELDLNALLTLYRSANVPSDLLSHEDLLDRGLAGRLLVKLSGASEQVRPLVEDLHKYFQKHRALRRCHRRIALALNQLELGFVSPWQ